MKEKKRPTRTGKPSGSGKSPKIPIKDTPQKKDMMSAKPFAKQAKKPVSDDGPIMRPLARSTNKNSGSMNSKRMKRLTGTLI